MLRLMAMSFGGAILLEQFGVATGAPFRRVPWWQRIFFQIFVYLCDGLENGDLELFAVIVHKK